jgi:signal peptidase I
METQSTRKPHVVLAFLAGFLGLGLGYVYVGKMRFGVAAIVGFCLTVGFFAWTRLIVQSAIMLWLLAVLLALIALFALIHPIVLAARNREVPGKRYNRWWFYLLWSVGTIVLGPIIFKTRAWLLGYETFRVASASMSPTLEEGELFVSDSWRYHDHAVIAGEIVVLERPQNPGVKFIKRVVAIAGDTIAIRDGVLYRNGQQVAEPYVHAPVPYGGSPRNVAASTLGPGLIYVLGDYRDNSLDSRQWGPFRTSSLRGRVQYIWLSIDKESGFRWSRVGTRLNP